MTPTDTIERVARAMIAKVHVPVIGVDPNNIFDASWLDDDFRETLRNMARAAIEAMREPTIEMRRAGAMTMPDYDPDIDDAERCWQEMIDAALGRGGV